MNGKYFFKEKSINKIKDAIYKIENDKIPVKKFECIPKKYL